ncbi:MAG: UTP--glucose-1-phosphate uridylyltransferase, partial [Clostridia bacterium]|nr:UTP--glucose-1-phosphate uridylyltransferase [Clostridia bacterium]
MNEKKNDIQVTKAVIPAAGLGTRFLPSTKAVPKEMMTIVDKPTLHYIVEEAVLSGAKDILIIVNEGKEAIPTYFSPSPRYDKLKKPALEPLNDLLSRVRFHYAEQKVLDGNGSAILLAKEFAAGEPVSVLFGDDIIYNPEDPVTAQLVRAYEKYGCGTVGVKEVSREAVKKYCTLDVTPLEGNVMRV